MINENETSESLGPIAVSFGKFQGPHIGHHAATQFGKKYARDNGMEFRVYTSNRHMKKLKTPRPYPETPLSPEQKAKHLPRILGVDKVHFEESPYSTIEKLLAAGHSHVHIILGSDRMEDTAPGLKEKYGDRVIPVQFGEKRSETKKGLAGASSTKLREHARTNNFEAFKGMLPEHVPDNHAREMFDDMREGLKKAKINLDEEVSVQTRIKLSRIAKRNAKIRAAKRRARRKRRRNIPQLKKRAKQEVKSQLRHKFAKRPWKKLGFASRVNIDKNVNRRKKIADTMVRRILPSVIRGENERLRSVSRHESFETILLPILNEAVRGTRKSGSTKKGVNSAQERVGARKRKQKQRLKADSKKKSGIVKGQYAVVKATSGKHAGRIMVVSKDSVNPNTMKEIVSADKFSLASGKKATTDKGFINTDSSIELYGMVKGEGKASVRKAKKVAQPKQKSKKKPKEDGPTPQQKKAQKELMDKQPKPMIPATKKATTKDSFATSHDSTSMEAGIAYQVNAAMGMSPQEMVKKGLIDEALLKSVMENNHESFAPSCLRAAQMLMKQYPGCIIRHTGRAKKEVKLTELAKENEMVDTTPKPDFLVEDEKTGKIVAAMSQKIGKDTQLGSGSPAELKTNLLWSSGQAGNKLTKQQQKILQKIIDIFDKQLKGNPRTQRGPVTLWQQGGEWEGKDKEIERREKLHREVTNLFNDLMNANEDLRSNFVYASLTGVAKFEPGVGIATHIFSANRDGTDAKITPISSNYARKISDDGKIKFQATFKSSAVETTDVKKKWQQFKKEKERLGQKIKMNEDWRSYALRSVLRTFLSESINRLSGSRLAKVLLEKLEDSVPAEPQTKEEAIQYLKDAIAYIGDDALKMYQFFEDTFDIDAVSPPIDYTEYAENTNKLTNSVWINDREHKISVEVPYDYTEQGTLQNEINESYLIEKRNYRKEYDNYHSRPEQRKNRAGRVKARRLMIKLGRARKGDGKDIDHKDGNPRNNGKKNLRVRSKSANRSDN